MSTWRRGAGMLSTSNIDKDDRDARRAYEIRPSVSSPPISMVKELVSSMLGTEIDRVYGLPYTGCSIDQNITRNKKRLRESSTIIHLTV